MTDANTAEVIEEPEVVEAEVEAIEEPEVAEEVQEEPESSTEEKEEDNSFQKRISEVTAQKREALERAEQAKAEAEYWKQRASQPEQSPLQPDKTLADFEYDEGAYSSYLIDWSQQQTQAQAQQYLRQQEQMRVQASHNARQAEFSSTVEDYEQVALNPRLNINQHMAGVIQQSDVGPEVLYHLGKNPDVAESLAQMSPGIMAMEMGRIAERLKTVKKQSVSNAPSPTPKIKAETASRPVSSLDPESDKLSADEWWKLEQKRLSKKVT